MGARFNHISKFIVYWHFRINFKCIQHDVVTVCSRFLSISHVGLLFAMLRWRVVVPTIAMEGAWPVFNSPCCWNVPVVSPPCHPVVVRHVGLPVVRASVGMRMR